MNPRAKKFLGAIVMVVFVIVYALLIALIAPGLLQGASKWAEAAFYAAAGLAWVLPLLPLVRWMERPAARSRGSNTQTRAGHGSGGPRSADRS